MFRRIANEPDGAVRHTKLRTAGMVATERGHISSVQWRWRIRLEIDRTMAGAVIAIGMVGRRGGRLTSVNDVFAPPRYRGFTAMVANVSFPFAIGFAELSLHPQ